MKPYILVAHNIIRFSWRKVHCRHFTFGTINMFSRHLRVKLKKSSHVRLGNHVSSDGYGFVVVDVDGELDIGNRVYFNDGIMISCKQKISIGNGCRFGPNVKIFDNDHMFDAEHGVKAEHVTGTVEIGDNCWIASNAVILRDTQIGNNCVIGAGCVVKGTVPDCSLVTQRRELVIRKIEDK